MSLLSDISATRNPGLSANSIVEIIVGGILGVALAELVDAHFSRGATAVGLSFILAFVAWQFARMHRSSAEHLEELHEQIDHELEHVHARVRYVPNSVGKNYRSSLAADPGYNESLQRIGEAQHSIKIIGDYSPPDGMLEPPANRDRYLSTIEDRLRENSEAGKAFTYVRIIQRPDHLLADLHEPSAPGQALLTRQAMDGDMQVFEHCAEVERIKAAARTRSLEIELKVCKFIPNCPSILIVDDRYVLFTIPVRHNELGSDGKHRTHGVLHMTDLKGGQALVRYFADVFQSVANTGASVVRVNA
jgi:hypothetical protein